MTKAVMSLLHLLRYFYCFLKDYNCRTWHEITHSRVKGSIAATNRKALLICAISGSMATISLSKKLDELSGPLVISVPLHLENRPTPGLVSYLARRDSDKDIRVSLP